MPTLVYSHSSTQIIVMRLLVHKNGEWKNSQYLDKHKQMDNNTNHGHCVFVYTETVEET
jgi:hypothetical protein